MLLVSSWSHLNKYNGNVWEKQSIGQFCLWFYIWVYLYNFSASSQIKVLSLEFILFKPGSGGTAFLWLLLRGILKNKMLQSHCIASWYSRDHRPGQKRQWIYLRFSCTSLCNMALVLLKDVMSLLDVGVRQCTDAKKKLLFSSKMAICPVTILLSASLSSFFLVHIFFSLLGFSADSA